MNFTDQQREEVKIIGSSLVKYIHKNNIENVMFLDRSARLGYIALIKSWKDLFPNDKRPAIYFTNPDGYRTNYRSRSEIVKDFKTTYINLLEEKNKPLMIFDVCMHWGDTMERVRDIMNRIGFKNIHIGLAQPPQLGYIQNIKPNFIALAKKSSKGCHPLGTEPCISKGHKVLSEILAINSDYDKEELRAERKYSNTLRKEIAEIFDERSLVERV